MMMPETKSLLLFLSFYDVKVKSLKPQRACTGVVLWLNDPPRYEHKSETQASQYANTWQDYSVQDKIPRSHTGILSGTKLQKMAEREIRFVSDGTENFLCRLFFLFFSGQADIRNPFSFHQLH